jgi:hypothetical protein
MVKVKLLFQQRAPDNRNELYLAIFGNKERLRRDFSFLPSVKDKSPQQAATRFRSSMDRAVLF